MKNKALNILAGLTTFDGRMGRLDFFVAETAITLIAYGLQVLDALFNLPPPAGKYVEQVDRVIYNAFSPAINSFDFFHASPGDITLAGLIATSLFYWALLSIYARRFHDFNVSGWAALVAIVPIIGGIVGVVLWFVPGNKKKNAYGPPPPRRDPDADLRS